MLRLLGGRGQASGAPAAFTMNGSAFTVEGEVEAPETDRRFRESIGVVAGHLELEELHRECEMPVPGAPTVSVLNLALISKFVCVFWVLDGGCGGHKIYTGSVECPYFQSLAAQATGTFSDQCS